jgi:hypothetical protein
MSSGRWLAAAAFALALCAALTLLWWTRRATPAAEPAPTRSEAPAAPERAPEPAPEAPSAEPRAAEPELPPLGIGAVDLEEVRAALPDNLYWATAAPTTDPALLEQRAQDAAFRNEQYGKILSGTGTEAEILDYYDHRMRASTDYIQFVDYLLEHYGSDLSDQDQTLLHLAKRLHRARLEEIPRRLQEARERKAQQDEARRVWLEEEREFRGEAADAPE